MAKETKKTLVEDQNPTGGGSYVRNQDGSLAVNEADQQKIKTADEVAGIDIPKE